jgi:hypothetical protein
VNTVTLTRTGIVSQVVSLTIALIWMSYYHFNLLTLGYLAIGISLLHRRFKLTADSFETSVLMAYSGFSLLSQAAFQYPGIPAGDAEDYSSWQVVLGFHKVSERNSDLAIAAAAFLIATALRGTIRSEPYQSIVLPREDAEFKEKALARRQRHEDGLAASVLEQDAKEKCSKASRAGARQRLKAQHRARHWDKRRERVDEANDSVEVSEVTASMMALDESVEPDVPHPSRHLIILQYFQCLLSCNCDPRVRVH